MGKIIDKDDFQRRLDEAKNIPVREELKLIITGQLDARKAFNEAKENALRKARRALARRIDEEQKKFAYGYDVNSHNPLHVAGAILAEIEEIKNGGEADELLKI